jgi:vacuolar protein sorting-associated protein 13A/C
MQIGLYARERLDLNLTSTFAEFAINTANSWSKIADQALTGTRGSYAPYHIRNRTGLRISIWPDNDGNADLQSGGIIIGSNEGTDWRFDDWKTMREVSHYVLIQ